eukprot:CAMPEP_0116155498 /NCGR_PEP_ID=MMETSP0329-20121206/22340_1 /TAXON_ID=697910 /ORGANISM="Pseudo-nitzschia arenysensis, Strain B593" /LENGTH=171 /DNA_ID=CAMNT_0003652537 /DNA_START=40 /DNA_END=552 /DNA_ORIENTATION=-
MVNASLASFHRLIQTTIKHQKDERKSKASSYSKHIISDALSKVSKIVGGNTYTAMICTGSPSSYSIDETIQTILFAQLMQKIYNQPKASFQGYTLQGYQMQLSLAESRQKQMTRLIRLISQECKYGKKKSREPKNPKVWDAVLQIVDADNETEESKIDSDEDTNFTISIHR